jgi:hypothetical protein
MACARSGNFVEWKNIKEEFKLKLQVKKKTLYFVLRLHPVFVKVTFTLQFASYSPQVYK